MRKCCLGLSYVISHYYSHYPFSHTRKAYSVYQKEKFKSPLALDFLHVPTSCLMESSLPSYVKAFPEQVSMPGSVS